MTEIIGLVLAGGQGRRLGGIDKGWHLYQGKPLVEHALGHLGACDRILISANRNQADYRALGHEVITDQRADYQGPLSGIESAMLYAPNACLYVMPCDLIGVPKNWLDRLQQQAKHTHSPWVGTQVSGRLQPLLGLWSSELLPELSSFLDAGERRVMAFIRPYQEHALQMPLGTCLLNINSHNA